MITQHNYWFLRFLILNALDLPTFVLLNQHPSLNLPFLNTCYLDLHTLIYLLRLHPHLMARGLWSKTGGRQQRGQNCRPPL